MTLEKKTCGRQKDEVCSHCQWFTPCSHCKDKEHCLANKNSESMLRPGCCYSYWTGALQPACFKFVKGKVKRYVKGIQK